MNEQRERAESAVYGITRFSDMTKGEFESKGERLICVHALNQFSAFAESRNTVIRRKQDTKPADEAKQHRRRFRRSLDSLPPDIPKRVDWRERGIISSVNNQGKCGACWAYSSVETIESMYALRTGRIQKLSVQELIDCSADGYNRGCDGGDTCEALEWMVNNKARLVPEADYPTRDAAGMCDIQPSAVAGVEIRSNFTCEK